MQEKLFASEAKVMEIIWAKSPISAKDISLIAAETIGWNKNTTYTVIKKLEAKGFIKRDDPGFICTPLISQNQMQKAEATYVAGNRVTVITLPYIGEESVSVSPASQPVLQP